MNNHLSEAKIIIQNIENHFDKTNKNDLLIQMAIAHALIALVEQLNDITTEGNQIMVAATTHLIEY